MPGRNFRGEVLPLRPRRQATPTRRSRFWPTPVHAPTGSPIPMSGSMVTFSMRRASSADDTATPTHGSGLRHCGTWRPAPECGNSPSARCFTGRLWATQAIPLRPSCWPPRSSNNPLPGAGSSLCAFRTRIALVGSTYSQTGIAGIRCLIGLDQRNVKLPADRRVVGH